MGTKTASVVLFFNLIFGLIVTWRTEDRLQQHPLQALSSALTTGVHCLSYQYAAAVGIVGSTLISNNIRSQLHSRWPPQLTLANTRNCYNPVSFIKTELNYPREALWEPSHLMRSLGLNKASWPPPPETLHEGESSQSQRPVISLQQESGDMERAAEPLIRRTVTVRPTRGHRLVQPQPELLICCRVYQPR